MRRRYLAALGRTGVIHAYDNQDINITSGNLTSLCNMTGVYNGRRFYIPRKAGKDPWQHTNKAIPMWPDKSGPPLDFPVDEAILRIDKWRPIQPHEEECPPQRMCKVCLKILGIRPELPPRPICEAKRDVLKGDPEFGGKVWLSCERLAGHTGKHHRRDLGYEWWGEIDHYGPIPTITLEIS